MPAFSSASWVALAFTLVSLCSKPCWSQAVQAVRGADEEVIPDMRPAVNEITQRTAKYSLYLGILLAQDVLPELRRQLAEVLEAGRAALAAQADIAKFRREYDRFRTEEERLDGLASSTVFALENQPEDVRKTFVALREIQSSPPIPQISSLIPDVVFTAGVDYTMGASTNGLLGVALSTNLLGAAAGTVFKAIKSEGLQSYFTDNLSAGPAFPIHGDHKISAQVGLGLGGVDLGVTHIYPVLNLESTDSADIRVPRAVVQRVPGEANWTTPVVSLAIIPGSRDAFIKKVSAGKFAWVITASVRLPYFYPGDPFSGLAALFTDDREKYEKAGDAAFALGVAVPLLRVKKQAPAKEEPEQDDGT